MKRRPESVLRRPKGPDGYNTKEEYNEAWNTYIATYNAREATRREVGTRIWLRAKWLGLPISGIAKKLGVSPTLLTRVINGEISMNPDFIPALSEILEVPDDWITNGTNHSFEMYPDVRILGTNIKRIREYCDFIPYHIKLLAKVDQSKITACEDLGYLISRDKAQRIADVFGISLADICDLNFDVTVINIDKVNERLAQVRKFSNKSSGKLENKWDLPKDIFERIQGLVSYHNMSVSEFNSHTRIKELVFGTNPNSFEFKEKVIKTIAETFNLAVDSIINGINMPWSNINSLSDLRTRIRIYREVHNISKRELSRWSGLHIMTISGFENGTSKTRTSAVVALCEGLKLDELLIKRIMDFLDNGKPFVWN